MRGVKPATAGRFDALGPLPESLRAPPRWAALGVASGVGALLATAPWAASLWPQGLARTGLAVSLVAYLGVSLLDLAEHFRLEREVSGRWLGWQAVPLGESCVHVAVTGVLLAAFALARPLLAQPTLRDAFVLASPLLFLALGWWDELAYHRRRATHREDILHTLSHLAGGALLAFLLIGRLLPWPAS